MKQTLLELTQEVLSSMDSDEVGSINDTAEALQVARCIRQAYLALIEDLDPPEHYTMFQLEESGDPTKPTLMFIPDTIQNMTWVKYNKIKVGETDPRYDLVDFMPMDQFLYRMDQLNTDEPYIGSYTIDVGTESFVIKYVNDEFPRFYTCFGDDHTLVFDNYDSTVDVSGLAKNKTQSYGKKDITFPLSDSHTPDLDTAYFSRLLNESKVLAFAELKSVDHAIANRNARRSRSKAAANRFRVQIESDFDQLPNFGRK